MLVSLDTRIPLQSQQTMPNSIEIGQRTGYEQSIGILHETAIAHLGETEDALDDQERISTLARTFDLVVFFDFSAAESGLFRVALWWVKSSALGACALMTLV